MTTPQQVPVVHDVIIAGIPLKLKSEKDYEAVNKLVTYVDKKITDALPAGAFSR